jgi:hypothetical protein
MREKGSCREGEMPTSNPAFVRMSAARRKGKEKHGFVVGIVA